MAKGICKWEIVCAQTAGRVRAGVNTSKIFAFSGAEITERRKRKSWLSIYV
ncbi:MAG: hypothetical protein ACLTEF_04555 [[Clostridium] leptum]